MIALVTFERVDAAGRVANWVQLNVRGNNTGRIDAIVERYRYAENYNRSRTMYGVSDSKGWLLRDIGVGGFRLFHMTEVAK